jgi:hypothetical protein
MGFFRGKAGLLCRVVVQTKLNAKPDGIADKAPESAAIALKGYEQAQQNKCND